MTALHQERQHFSTICLKIKQEKTTFKLWPNYSTDKILMLTICQPQMRLKPQLEGKNGNRLWKLVLVLGAVLSLGARPGILKYHPLVSGLHGILADKLSTAKGIFSSRLGASSSVLIFFPPPAAIFCSTALDVHAICRA